MPFQQLDKARFTFVSAGIQADTFAVVRLEGEEALSRPYRFELTLVANRSDIDIDEIVEQPATLSFYGSEGKEAKQYRGVLAEFDVLRQVDDITFYRAVLVPRFWQLTRYRISEVYLGERTAPQIVEFILRSAGFSPGIDYEMRLSSEYRQRSFVCQYQETHLDFISRWLEWEGIYYWFVDEGGHEKIVFADNRTAHDSAVTSLAYRPGGQLDTTYLDDTLHGFTCRRTPLPAKVVVQDYNYRKSPLEVKAEAVVSQRGLGEVMFYGENVRTNAEAEKVAGIRAEEIACGGRRYFGETSAPGLRSGCFATVAKHFRTDFNQRYLLTSLRHEGSQAAVLLAGIDGSGGKDEIPFYRAEFTGIPSDVQFRPERTTPKPRFHGTMNATVDAEGTGQYAELNEYGQYKVQLPFDKTDKQAGKASAWLRMASPYAGGDYGMHMPVHKGAEVLLSFTDGDPDQPVIIGAVPNSENRNMVTNANQTQSVIHTAGDNHIAIEDQEGKKRILMHSPTQSTFIRIGAPNDPWHSHWQHPVLRMSDDGDSSGGGDSSKESNSVVGYSDNYSKEEYGTFYSNEGLKMATKGCVMLEGQTKNEIIFGEASETFLGLKIENMVGGAFETTLIYKFEFSAGWHTEKGDMKALFCEDKMELMATDIKTANTNISTIDTKVSTIDTKVSTLSQSIATVATRVDTVEQGISNIVTDISDIETDISNVGTKVNTLEQCVTTVATRVDTVEQGISNIVTNISDIETDISNIETDIKTSMTKIENCETAIEDQGNLIATHETLICNSGLTMLN